MQVTDFAIFGEVLFDRFPDGLQVLGGAPFNVAWHLQAFGQNPIFISRIGADAAGDEIRSAMQAWGMAATGLQSDPEHPTGAVAVSFAAGEPSYEILDQQAYDFIDPIALPAVNCQLLYHGSLALRHVLPRQALANLKSRRQAKVFMDVNLRAPWWNPPLLEAAMQEADWLKLNSEELALLQAGEQSVEAKMYSMLERYALAGLVLTCGAEGAIAMQAGGEMVKVVPESALTLVDTVGAGDAFAAVLLLGIQQDWPLTVTMQRAQQLASAIVGQRGATVSDREFYRRVLNAWGTDVST